MGELNLGLFLASSEGFPTDLLVATVTEGEVNLAGFLISLLESFFSETRGGLGLTEAKGYM